MKFRSKEEAPTAYPDELLVIGVGSWRYQKPVLDKKRCSHCGACLLFCPTGCIAYAENNFVINLDFCKGCGICARNCSRGAITMIWEAAK